MAPDTTRPAPASAVVIRPCRTCTGTLTRTCAGVLCLCVLLCVSGPAHALETSGMKGPKSKLVTSSTVSPAQTPSSTLQPVLLRSIRLFQKWISPVDGPRCRFSPTCSQFGYEAVRDRGATLGVIMTADRLMRCSYWSETGPVYARLPNGALHDPVAHNH